MFKQLFFMACLAYSTTALAELSEATMNRLLKASGAEVQLNLLPDSMREFGRGALNQNAQSDEPMDIESILEQMFQPEGFFNAIRNEMNARLTPRDADLLLAWFDSPEGQRVTRAEEEASTPAAIRDMRRRAASLLLNERRVELANTINGLNDSNAMFLSLQEHMIFRIIEEMQKVKKSRKDTELKELKVALDQSRAERLAGLKQGSIINLVYSYKKLEYSLIEKYIEFLKTPEAQAFNDSVKAGMEAELRRNTDAIAVALAAEYQRVNDKKKTPL